MSNNHFQDFSTPSLQGVVAMEMNDAVSNDDDIDKYQIRKTWEQRYSCYLAIAFFTMMKHFCYDRPHPYIFFNKDKSSITFVGFTVTKQGDLFDPIKQKILEHSIMTPQLYSGLVHNRVNFQDDYRNWNKAIMIEKISTVMGVEFPYDPDETYVLTVDNVIKILAIQMRFRQVINFPWND